MANPTPSLSNIKEIIHQTTDYNFLSELKTYCETLWAGGNIDKAYAIRHWFRELNKKSFSVSSSLFYTDHDGGFTPSIYQLDNLRLYPWFTQGASVGNLSTTYTEYSGLSHSTKEANKDYLWAIEDGATTYILVINRSNASLAGKWTISGITTSDIEDIASAKVNGISYIWLADTGDNANARSTIKLIRVEEPTVIGSNGTISTNTTITCQFPAANIPSHKDIECIFADPDTGDIYFITKRISPVKCYRLQFAESYSGTQTLEFLGNLTNDATFNTISNTYTNNNGYVTGGDISPNGSEIILRSYSQLYYWYRNKASETIYEALSRAYDNMLTHSYVGGGGSPTLTTAPKCLHPNQEPQGESVAFDYEGVNIYTCSEYLANEGTTASAYPLFKYLRLSKEPTIIEFQQGVNSYTGTRDTFIDSSTPTTDNSSITSLVADFDYSLYPTISRTREILLKFDISSIPSGATITGAYLTIYINTEGKNLFLYKLLRSWEHTDTYNSLSGGISLDNVEAASTPEVYVGVSTAGQGIDTYVGFIRLNLSLSTVQGWLDNPASNHGYVMTGGVESSGDGLQIDSCESVTVNRRPKLTISYTV